MASKHGKRHSPKFKFQGVREAFESEKADAEIVSRVGITACAR